MSQNNLMAESIGDVSIKLLQLLLTTIILCIMVYRRKKQNIIAFNWFIAIFSLAELQGIAEIIIFIVKVNILSIPNPAYFRFNEYHNIPYGMAIFVIYLLAENMDGLQPKPWRFTLVIGLWFSYFSLMLFQTFDEYDITFSNKPAANQTFNVIFDFYQLAAMSIVSYVFYKSYLISKNRENKRATFAIFLAAAVYVVAVLYELGESLLSFPDVYGVLTFTLTFIILAYVYIRYPYFVFTVPQKIHRIILATEDGLYLYSAEIEEQDTDTSNELLAGGLAAISKFLAEAVGSRNNLRYSVLGDRVLLVSQLQNVIGFIVADRGARILSSALDHFVYEFVKEYKNEIQNFNAIVTQFDKIESIITRCFPFVEANDIIRQRIS